MRILTFLASKRVQYAQLYRYIVTQNSVKCKLFFDKKAENYEILQIKEWNCKNVKLWKKRWVKIRKQVNKSEKGKNKNSLDRLQKKGYNCKKYI